MSDSRKIVGIGNTAVEMERRLAYMQSVLSHRISYHGEGAQIRQVVLNNSTGSDVVCLVMTVPQTSAAVAVDDGNGRFSYPRRREGGLERVEQDTIISEKRNIHVDNSDFLDELNRFVEESAGGSAGVQ